MGDNVALSARRAPSLDLLGIRQFPRDKQQPDTAAIGDAVKIRVIELLKQKLSPAEREVWNSAMSLQNAPSVSPIEKQIVRKFDEVLMRNCSDVSQLR